MKFLILSGFLLVFKLDPNAQLQVSMHWGSEEIALGKWYQLRSDSLTFQEIKCYLSDFTFEKEGRKQVIVGPILFDAEDSSTWTILKNFPVKDYKSISFHFGMDSLYHVSEILEGPLNPMNGMYWAWNSGYIQFKCTGNSSSLPISDQQFEYHLGGYRQPYETMVPVELVLKGTHLILDLKPFFENTVNFQQAQRIMIPGKTAKDYCQKLSPYFYSE